MEVRAFVAVGIASIAAFSHAQPCDPVLEVGETHTSSSVTWSVTTGDFNADGHLDLLTGWIPMQVYLGNADGTFTVGEPLFLIEGPELALGDLNDDNHLDFAVASLSNFGARIVLGNGDGTFESAQLLTDQAAWVTSIAVADLNGDGAMDVAFSDWAEIVWIFLGNGDGTFEPARTEPIGNIEEGDMPIQAADIDLDGDQDLLVGAHQHADQTQLRVLFNNGDATFQPFVPTSLPTGREMRDLLMTDLNDDAIPDAVAALDNTTCVLIGIGDGTFAEPICFGSAGEDTVAADFDGDQIIDLGVVNYDNPPSLSIYRGAGDGTFSFAQSVSFRERGLSVAQGDFNGDGRPDCAVGSELDMSKTTILLNVCSCPADLNNDGTVDADDFFTYLDLFAAGDPRADITGDEVIDADDFFAYLDLFAADCD